VLIPFVKMQAQGNDFVILNAFSAPLPEVPFAELARRMCLRHFSVGADGLVILKGCDEADAEMIIYNSDGSRAEMCGSALRCVSKLAAEHLGKTSLRIKTDSGIKAASILPSEGIIQVNLGSAQLVEQDLEVSPFTGDLLDIGNPHFVVWMQDLEADPQLEYGAYLEHHPAFKAPVNAHFARVINDREIEMRIWEHACGATLACGTGAACTVYSGINKGLLQDEVLVHVPGGEIGISYLKASDELLLSGSVNVAYTGVYEWKA
jgi:diaminopimelate epimerase